MKVLVTGGTGHVGSALLRSLSAEGGRQLRATVRRPPGIAAAGCEYVNIGSLTAGDLQGIASGCHAVVHTAARVHVMRETSTDAIAAYRETNVHGTLNLAREAVRAGVRRFVFLSSVKVNGEASPPGRGFREDDPADPHGGYAISKFEAEGGLREICAASGMQLVIIRPPLVYGPRVGANFLSLARAVKRGIPLPLGAIHNRRSLVAIDNLVDFIRLCMDHPAASDETLLVSDGHDLSTPELVRAMAAGLGRPARLVSVPTWMLRTAGVLTGRQAAVQRLLENLQVDIGKARKVLGWSPPVTVEAALRLAMQDLRDP